jgi:hypothetical protein
MLHRQRVREATVAALLNVTAAGDRVYPSPVVPWRRERPLPAIGVYTLAEAATPWGQSGPFQLRQELDLVIEALVEVVTDTTLDAEARLRIDTAAPLDALCAEITDALLSNPAWYGEHGAAISGIDRWSTRIELARVDEADRRTAAATLTWTVTYSCVAEPRVIDRFERLHLDVDVLDPAADPNTTGHPTTPPAGYAGGYPGPDGRIEVDALFPRPIDPPLWPAKRPVKQEA